MVDATEHEWYHAHRTGLLVAIHRNVSRLAGTFPTIEMHIAAAVLAAGPTSLASHRSAAHLWGIPRGDGDPVDIIVDERGSLRRYDGVVAHRPNDLLDLHPAPTRLAIPCTTIERTLLDLGAVDRFAVRGAVGHALTTGLTTLDQLRATVIDHSQRGRHGVVALRRALDDWSIHGRPADSVLEVAMVRLAERHRLPPLEFHPIIEGWEIDFRVSGTPVLIECDGWTHHGLDRDQFERDRRRDAELAAAGWVTLRFTYRAVVQDTSCEESDRDRWGVDVGSWTSWRTAE
jgi:very-short-patch-repair endonuclease